MSAPVLTSRHVLVVDDEPLVCDAVRMLLAFDGHIVQTAHNARDALGLFEPGKYDVVITDFEMPDMKGDELARKIKARDPKQPVVMITAYSELLRASGTPLGAIDFMIGKPFLLENLREALAKAATLTRSTEAGTG